MALENVNAEFLAAVQSGNTARVEALLNQPGVDINTCDKDGNTALHLAAFADNPALFESLVTQGAATHIKNQQGQTALDCVGENIIAYARSMDITSLFDDTKSLNTDNLWAIIIAEQRPILTHAIAAVRSQETLQTMTHATTQIDREKTTTEKSGQNAIKIGGTSSKESPQKPNMEDWKGKPTERKWGDIHAQHNTNETDNTQTLQESPEVTQPTMTRTPRGP